MSDSLVVAVLVRVDLRTGLVEIVAVPGCEPSGPLQAQQLLEAAADVARSAQVYRPVVWH